MLFNGMKDFRGRRQRCPWIKYFTVLFQLLIIRVCKTCPFYFTAAGYEVPFELRCIVIDSNSDHTCMACLQNVPEGVCVGHYDS